MKRFAFLCTAVIAAMTLTTNAEAQISVNAGYNLISHTSQTVVGNTTFDDEPTNLHGFYVNGAYNIAFLSKGSRTLSVEPGLTYSFGGKILSSERLENSYSKVSRRDHYLDIPINLKYSFDLLPRKVRISTYLGPILSFGLAAAEIAHTELGDYWMSSRLNLYSNKYTLNSSEVSFSTSGNEGDIIFDFFDLRIGIGIGITILENYLIQTGYHFGLLNRASAKETDFLAKPISHTNVFHIGVGYIF